MLSRGRVEVVKLPVDRNAMVDWDGRHHGRALNDAVDIVDADELVF